MKKYCKICLELFDAEYSRQHKCPKCRKIIKKINQSDRKDYQHNYYYNVKKRRAILEKD